MHRRLPVVYRVFYYVLKSLWLLKLLAGLLLRLFLGHWRMAFGALPVKTLKRNIIVGGFLF